jgi:hypothetical protein
MMLEAEEWDLIVEMVGILQQSTQMEIQMLCKIMVSFGETMRASKLLQNKQGNSLTLTNLFFVYYFIFIIPTN